jgi:hypothetical protein
MQFIVNSLVSGYTRELISLTTGENSGKTKGVHNNVYV